MSNDTELFELCKQVHEAMGWEGTDFNYYPGERSFFTIDRADNKLRHAFVLSPLYTSDYLLEKLPGWIDHGRPILRKANLNQWSASYDFGPHESYIARGSTPLKSLLKLCLALHKQGLLTINTNDDVAASTPRPPRL